MKGPVTTASAVAVLLLATGSASHARPLEAARQLETARSPLAAAPCSGQLQPNPGFERGTTGWTAGPRIVVLADRARPAHTGRAYATFAGLNVTHTDSLRTSVTIPAGCALTIGFWARVAGTETLRGDYLNVGLTVTGEPPKTRYSFAFDHSRQWQEHPITTAATATERTAAISFYASETEGNGVTTFDVDDVTFTLS